MSIHDHKFSAKLAGILHEHLDDKGIAWADIDLIYSDVMREYILTKRANKTALIDDINFHMDIESPPIDDRKALGRLIQIFLKDGY